MKTILYTDGGCSGNEQRELSKRNMIAAVTDEHGTILIDKHQEGGSNNIAELLAVKEALEWCVAKKICDVEIRTDSTNNLAWVLGKKVGKKINDRDAVIAVVNLFPHLFPEYPREVVRSEEHTSELQSHLNLVCR